MFVCSCTHLVTGFKELARYARPGGQPVVKHEVVVKLHAHYNDS